jgi:lysozyme
MLREDLEASWRSSARLCHPLAAADVSRGAAIADFTFNLGPGRLRASTLRRRVNKEDWDSAAREMRRWVYAGGKKLRGLVLRREVAALWLELGDV